MNSNATLHEILKDINSAVAAIELAKQGADWPATLRINDALVSLNEAAKKIYSAAS